VGYDNFDLESMARHDVPVAACPGFTSSRALADHALMLMLMVLRRYADSEDSVMAGRKFTPIGRELAGLTLLTIGFGFSARELARRASAAGMTVMTVQRREPDSNLMRRFGVRWAGTFDQLDEGLSRADVVSLHVPLADSTRNLLNRERLKLMKPGSIVVNVSRGGLVDEVALHEEIHRGHLFGAGLDVLLEEPARTDHPLLALKHVVITPHIAGHAFGTYRRRARFAAMNVGRVSVGREPLCRIYPTGM
jgi:D-3-phosphoglycerate dehydrogenase